eukprot:9045934-Pyramimonas_sp.AAC.1
MSTGQRLLPAAGSGRGRSTQGLLQGRSPSRPLHAGAYPHKRGTSTAEHCFSWGGCTLSSTARGAP